MLTQKLLLTGLLIFIKPGTTSQLACGFAISIYFFVLHVRVSAYARAVEDDLQFCSMLSITLTLFGGILLKTDTQDEDPNGAAAMAFLLLVINVGVICLFIYQTYKAFTEPPEDSAALSDLALEAIKPALEEARPAVAKAIQAQGFTANEAESIQHALDTALDTFPGMLSAAEDVGSVVENLKSIITGGGK